MSKESLREGIRVVSRNIYEFAKLIKTDGKLTELTNKLENIINDIEYEIENVKDKEKSGNWYIGDMCFDPYSQEGTLTLEINGNSYEACDIYNDGVQDGFLGNNYCKDEEDLRTINAITQEEWDDIQNQVRLSIENW